MYVFRRVTAGLLLLALSVSLVDASNQAKPLQIGMANSFFFERSKSVVEIAAEDFKDVMKKTTGLTGELDFKHGAAEVAQKLNNQEFALGIFYAHEFTWMKKKYPELQPLMIAANRHPERAFIVVHKNSPARSVADLGGMKFDVPNGSIAPARLYLERVCAEAGVLFGVMQKSKSQSRALDEVASGNVHAALVDVTELESYKRIRGPVFMANLRVLQQSNTFPPALIAYKQGGVDQATLTQFRDGLLKAHTIRAGRDMMKEWNIDAFELVPKDYAKSLDELVKAYPPPASLR